MDDVKEKTHDTSSGAVNNTSDLPKYGLGDGVSPVVTVGDAEEVEEMFKHANRNDADEAMRAFAGHEGESLEITPEMERKLLRKIDLNLMPVSHGFLV